MPIALPFVDTAVPQVHFLDIFLQIPYGLIQNSTTQPTEPKNRYLISKIYRHLSTPPSETPPLPPPNPRSTSPKAKKSKSKTPNARQKVLKIGHPPNLPGMLGWSIWVAKKWSSLILFWRRSSRRKFSKSAGFLADSSNLILILLLSRFDI